MLPCYKQRIPEGIPSSYSEEGKRDSSPHSMAITGATEKNQNSGQEVGEYTNDMMIKEKVLCTTEAKEIFYE